MTNTSTTAPAPSDNWSNFGAIVVVSILGPALLLLMTFAPAIVLELASVVFDFNACKYLSTCAPGGSGAWSAWLINEAFWLYVLWVNLGAGFACVVVLESTIQMFRRANPVLVLSWYVALMFALALLLPIDWLRGLLSLGWGGTVLVTMHIYLSYKELALYQPPRPSAERAIDALPLTCEDSLAVEIPGEFSPQQKRALGTFALYTIAMFGIAYYAFEEDLAILCVIAAGNALYLGLLLLHKLIAWHRAQSLVIDHTGLVHHGQGLLWGEIGRVWPGPKGYEHVVVIEAPAAAAQRILQATSWVNRLFTITEVARRSADLVAHTVLIDTRLYSDNASELVQMIEAHRPPGSRWTPTSET